MDVLNQSQLPGDETERARTLWKKIAAGDLSGGDLTHLLLALWKKWQPGTLAAELARALLAEANSREPEPEPEALFLAEIESLPKTERIDGVLPLSIPVPADLGRLADELVEEALRLKLGSPPSEEAREELTIAFLPLLHRRPLVSSHRLPILMYAACPLSATSRPGETLMLLG